MHYDIQTSIRLTPSLMSVSQEAPGIIGSYFMDLLKLTIDNCCGIFFVGLYFSIHICYESCKKIQHDFNWNSVSTYHATAIFNKWPGGILGVQKIKTKLYFDIQRDIIHTLVQLIHKKTQNLIS